MNNKSPFRGFSTDEILGAEAVSFVIMLGKDFYCKNGGFVFSRKQAEKNYNNILSKIKYAVNNGNKKQQKDALECLSGFYILPLRIQ